MYITPISASLFLIQWLEFQKPDCVIDNTSHQYAHNDDVHNMQSWKQQEPPQAAKPYM